MACEKCRSLEANTNLSAPHVIRSCKNCGGDYAIRETGKNGLGLEIKEGDRVVIPAGFIKIAANPLKATGQLFRPGVDFFAKMVFGVDISKSEFKDNFAAKIEQIQEENEKWFTGSASLSGLDLNDPAFADEAYEILKPNSDSVEWWGYLAAMFANLAADAVKSGNASEAAWAITASERFRSLCIFKEHFADVVFMGHSAGRLVQLLQIWDSNKENGNEDFWQQILQEHSYAFSQLFSAPVTFLEGRAYVGGTQLDGTNARYLDFMLTGGTANHALLVEIKTPLTKLLTAKYRGNAYPVSRDLSGSIVQVQDYCDVLRQEAESITRQRDLELNTFNPRRIVLIGNYERELVLPKQRASFELFRSALSGVEIITFDEFFLKIEQLAKLFNLTRSGAPDVSA